MGMGALHTRSIKTKRKFTLDEIYALLVEEGNLPAEPYLAGKGFMRGLFVPAVGKYDVSITSMGKKVTCCEYVRQGEQALNLGLNVLTNSWSTILDTNSFDSRAITDLVADELVRLLSDRA